MAQIVIGIAVLGVLVAATFLMYQRRKNERPDQAYLNEISFDNLLERIKKDVSDLVKTDDTIMANDSAYEARMRNIRRIDKALTDCVYGIDSAKNVVIGVIREILAKQLPTMENVCKVYDFELPDDLPVMVKFEVLLYRLMKDPDVRSNAINYLDKEYNLTEARIMDEDESYPRYEFDYKKLDIIFGFEMRGKPLSYEESLDVLAILMFQKYKGFGCIDTLRSLKIDGLNFGTSGSVRYEIENKWDARYKATNSVWVQINTKWVHFSFLDFYKAGEMRRVVSQLVSYGTTSPMTEKSPKKVADMYDGSRVTAIRPPAGECWACFIRKFTLGYYKIRGLLDKPTVKNWELPATLIYFLMRAGATTGFTGQQNTGKTTIMKAAVEFVINLNIRVLEMSFELGLREIYPFKNIFTVKPTDYVRSSEIQDTLKKTDSWLSMVGEVAEDIVAARMIQFSLVGSDFTMFSHHGKDDDGLVNGLANSLVASGEYENHDVAVSTVLDAVKNNVHLAFVKGERVIEYISEIVKEDEVAPYPEVFDLTDIAAAIVQLTKTQHEFYTRSTDRVRFTSRKIIKFNPNTMSYEPGEWYSPETAKKMLNKMTPADQKAFTEFFNKHWGKGVKAS